MNTLIDLNTADFVGTSYNNSLRCKNLIIKLFSNTNINLCIVVELRTCSF